jgi:hypothetical protein
MSVEAYNRLKNEFTLYKQQSEETKKNLLETIKHLKESNEILKKEKNILSSDPNAKELKKLKEENIQLQKKLMDLEGEQLNLNNDNLLTNSFANNSYLNNNLITTENNTVNTSLIHNIKQTSTFNKNEKKLAKANFNFSLIANKGYNKIKESLKNKNEEITILKNELLKKEKLIENLKYKIKLQPKNLKSNINKPNNSISINKNSNNNNSNHHIQSEKIILTYFDINSIKPNSLYKNKSDNDFLRSTLIKYNNKYLKTEILRSYTKRKSIDMDYNANNNTINVSLMTSFMEDESGHNALEKNIYSEIKNILEEKRNFIIKTMTSENFSFDIINSSAKKDINDNNNNNNNNKNVIVKKKLYSNSNKGSNVNIRGSITNNNSSNEISNVDIDKMINLIKNRKKEVEIKKKYFEELRDKFI